MFFLQYCYVTVRSIQVSYCALFCSQSCFSVRFTAKRPPETSANLSNPALDCPWPPWPLWKAAVAFGSGALAKGTEGTEGFTGWKDWGVPSREFLGRFKVMPRLVKATPTRAEVGAGVAAAAAAAASLFRGGISNHRSTAGFRSTRFCSAAVIMFVQIKMKTPQGSDSKSKPMGHK